jgi:hypothetical protein
VTNDDGVGESCQCSTRQDSNANLCIQPRIAARQPRPSGPS